MDALARLDDYLVQAMDAPVTIQAEDKPKFQIDTKEHAIWALRKIAAIERGRKEAQEAAQAEITRMQDWLAGEEKRADQAREYLDFLLEDYHRRVLAENPKAKTIKLPHGETQLRAQQPDLFRNDMAILIWARKNRPELVTYPHWVRPDPKLEWANLKKLIKVVNGQVIDKETGEVIPGITAIEHPPKFNIKLSEV